MGKVPPDLRCLGPKTELLALLPQVAFAHLPNTYPDMSSSSNNSVLSHLAIPIIQAPPNNQASQIGVDNLVTMQDIKCFANLNTSIPDKSANHLIHHEANPPQQISHLDICVHDQSRTRWGPGTYPTNYEVASVALQFGLKLTFS